MQPEYGVPQQPKAGLPAWAFCIIIPCGCGILGVPILAALLFPNFSKARDSARSIACLSNIKLQGTGILMYSEDYDQLLPPSSAWMDTINPYIKQERDYHCPSVSTQDSSAFGYAYNSALSKKPQSKIASPQTTIMTYDSSNLAKNASDAVTSLPNPPRHSGKRINQIGYADGHAKSKQAGTGAPGE
jgi:prepilin-type processing-associated H-X9-DG protein